MRFSMADISKFEQVKKKKKEGKKAKGFVFFDF